MQKLLTFKDLLLILGVSEATGRRYIAADDFPKPVSGIRKKLLFRPEDIERWVGCRDPPSGVQIESAAQRSKRHADAMDRLRAKGVKVSPKASK